MGVTQEDVRALCCDNTVAEHIRSPVVPVIGYIIEVFGFICLSISSVSKLKEQLCVLFGLKLESVRIYLSDQYEQLV